MREETDTLRGVLEQTSLRELKLLEKQKRKLIRKAGRDDRNAYYYLAREKWDGVRRLDARIERLIVRLGLEESDER